MIHTFLLMMPFGIAGAVSPMMLTEQTMLLATTGDQKAGQRYALGAFLVALVFIAVIVTFGRAISLPQEPRLSASLDILIGALLVVGSLILRKPRDEGKRKKKNKKTSRFSAGDAFGFGAFSMATNFTSLALILPAAKIVAASDLDFPLEYVLGIVLGVMVSTPAWLPLALTAIAPGPAERGLAAFGDFITARGRMLTVLFLAALGLLLIIRGAVHVS